MSNVTSGGGMAAIAYTLRKSLEAYGGPVRFWRRMASPNSCKTCAYGMGGQAGGMRNELGHFPEFCKKSVQAMAADMQPPLAPDFFERNAVAELAKLTPRELENLGRLAYPVLRRGSDTHYARIDWDEALDRIAMRMRAASPERTFFYSSGRSSNEAAFLLQWLARVYGTNNVNNCSYYCHQASGVGLAASIGTGTATVTLDDVEHADFVLLIGANPASNHPRLITTLAKIRSQGGKVIVVNPLRETGLDRFNIPSRPLSLLFGSAINDDYLQPRIGGDIALLKGLLKVVIDEGALDERFIAEHTSGFDVLRAELDREPLEDLAADCGVDIETVVRIGRGYAAARNAVFMWAMGITHHEHGVDNVHAIANLALARGMVGRPNAGLMPIRGHSNVQGIGSVGFAPELKAGFLKAMEDLYGLKVPEGTGMDSMTSLHAAHDGGIDFALLMGGNFYAANPDLTYAARALGRIGAAVHISTKLNQGHVCVSPEHPEGEVLILPTCVRDEELQSTTQESMFSFVRLSDGGMGRPSSELKSEVEIITGIGARLLPEDGPVNFRALRNHDEIRRVMASVVPGYAKVGEIGRTREEFHVEGRLRHEPRFPLPDGRARFVPVATPRDVLAPGELRLMTIRSEGQFNTVVYEEHDRYRNQPGRDVIMMNPADIAVLGLQDGDRVTVRSETGAMPGIRVAAYDIARGSAAMYYPEANLLVGTRVDPKSGTPSYKNVRVRVER
ncbi:MAG: FdhF/YdeP family oxidoreductase [Bacteroidetes bacterium]|nr:FdhF/YdeP family oxidoreductase [Bacteroidota bacterium]